MLDEIETIASNKSYEFVNASINEKLDDKINVTIKILDDQPNIYISKINIFGNNITIEDVMKWINNWWGDPFNNIFFKNLLTTLNQQIFQNVEALDTDDNSLRSST